jgi:hypothetical protein
MQFATRVLRLFYMGLYRDARPESGASRTHIND